MDDYDEGPYLGIGSCQQLTTHAARKVPPSNPIGFFRFAPKPSANKQKAYEESRRAWQKLNPLMENTTP